jgi:hypothetical protein
MSTYYLLFQPGGTEALTYGPYASKQDRDADAVQLIADEDRLLPPGEEDILVGLSLEEAGALEARVFTRREIVLYRLESHPEERGLLAEWL